MVQRMCRHIKELSKVVQLGAWSNRGLNMSQIPIAILVPYIFILYREYIGPYWTYWTRPKIPHTYRWANLVQTVQWGVL